MRDEASTRPRGLVAGDVVDQLGKACPTGFLWYSCATNKFIGCCSINPCGLGASCPADSQLPIRSTSSTPRSSETTRTAVTSPVVVSSIATTSSAATPAGNTEITASQTTSLGTTNPLITSPGAPSPSTTSSGIPMSFITSVTTSTASTSAIASTLAFTSTQSAFFTTLSASETITVFVPLSSHGSPTASMSTVPSTTAPTSSPDGPPPQSTSPTSAAIVNIGTNDGQNFPLSMVVGIVTGFSILILVMGVMFCMLWRNRRIRVVDDDEAMELQQRRLASRPWYLPQIPKPEEEPSVDTPVGTRGFPELDVPFRDRYPEMPRRSTFPDINKPCPPVPLSASRPSSGPTPGALDRRHDIFMMGRRLEDYGDPLRANIGVANITTPYRQSLRAIPYSLSNAAFPQHHCAVSSPSSRTAQGVARSPPLQGNCCSNSNSSGGAMLRHSTSGSVSAFESMSGGGGGGCCSNHSRRRDSELESELTSMAAPRAGYVELDSQSHYYELTPPPRRRPHSEGSEAKSAGAGRISRHSGLRLSGVSQGLVEEKRHGKDADNPPTDNPLSYSQRIVGGRRENDAVPSSSGQRRLTQ